MLSLRRSQLLLCALTPLLGAGAVYAQAYPSKLIRIVTAATGSANDWGSRVLAQELTTGMGQQVIVENRGGLSMENVAKAPPDGHTMLGYGSAAWLTQFLRDGVNWDVTRDFIAVSLAMSSPNILVV
ncbi:MAG: tripartite tricarboxylate transporter substrate-binding protein, partial [Betaproteobacteria bacterium]